MSGLLLKDKDWVRQSFLVKLEDLEKVDQQNRIFSSVSLKFVDTSPGGNFAINPPPQFTEYCDLRPNSISRRVGSKGMGRYYSEAIDDNNQNISMRFGVPQFNSLTSFFGGFYNTAAGRLARTGRSDGIFYNLGKAAGYVISLMSWKLLAVHALGYAFNFAIQKNSTKFYYLKPTMPVYWNTVQTMVNHIASNLGIVPRVFGDTDAAKVLGDNYQFSQAERDKLKSLLPDIFNKNGSIDVFAMANRAQRLAVQQKKLEEAAFSDGIIDNLSKRIHEVFTKPLKDKGANYDKYLDSWTSSAVGKPPAGGGDANDKDFSSEQAITTGSEKIGKDGKVAPPATAAGFMDFLKSEWDDGAAFATFRVNTTGSVSESFSNSVGESDLAGKLNGMSSSARSTNFSFANGNIDDGFIGKAVGGALSAVKDTVAGVMDGVGLSGLAILGGGAFVDIPKHWQNSTANLPRSTYTINLVSPYGNPISRLINLYVPLCMLLAAALPISTGRHSYTSPFILELYDKGRCQTRLGMIDSLQITRGTGNTGFTSDGYPLGIEVSFSIVDMSSIMHIPVSEGFSSWNVIGNALRTFSEVFDDDNVYCDYMAVLSGLGIADQIYGWRKFKLNLTRKMADWNSWASPAHFASVLGDTLPSRMISAFYRGTVR